MRTPALPPPLEKTRESLGWDMEITLYMYRGYNKLNIQRRRGGGGVQASKAAHKRAAAASEKVDLALRSSPPKT